MSLKPYQLLKYNNDVLYTKNNKKNLNNPILNVARFMVSTYRWTKHSLVTLLANHIIYYPSPINLTYAWSFGSAAGICLVIQILSGIFLAMHYTPHIDLAFSSIERIMRDGAGCSILVCFLYIYFFFFTGPRSFALVFKTMLRKPSAGMNQVTCLDCPALHWPLATPEYRLRLLEMGLYSCLKPAIADLSFILWHLLKPDYQILV
jgi:hypothetical protein